MTTGGSLIDPRIVEALVTPVRDDSLNAAEEDLLRQIAEGRHIKAIAVSERTTPEAVSEAVERLFRKLADEAGRGAAPGRDRQRRRRPLPARRGSRRLFLLLEALQNVAKYAGATRAVVRLADAGGELQFAVEDDGAGFDPATTARGSGLQNMVDRVEALGGTLEVTSTPGSGTTVAGSVPSRTHGAAEEVGPAAPAVGRTP